MTRSSFFTLQELAEKPLEFEGGRITVRGWAKARVRLGRDACHFGVVHKARATLAVGGHTYTVPHEHYFRAWGEGTLSDGVGLLVSVNRSPSRPTQIGSLPSRGALTYRPGGRMTAICQPDVKGEPTLNMLEMDPSIQDQEDHYHRSLRVNLVVSGSVICTTHTQEPKELRAGHVIVLHPGEYHKFTAGPEGMRFVAFHPDSNYGPTVDDNPMLNNTFY